MPFITKQSFLNTLFCPSYGWLTHSNKLPQSPSLADQLRMEEGIEIHQIAQSLFPNGHIISSQDISKAAKETQQLMADNKIPILFEPTFEIDEYATRADILKRGKSDWHLIEVKSSTNLKDELIDDMAYTAIVIMATNIKLRKCSLMLISKDYRLGMSDDELFLTEDVTEEVLERVGEFESQWDEVKIILQRRKSPDPQLSWSCKGCELFPECMGKEIDNHIFDLPRLSHTKFCQLVDLDVLAISSIPEDFELTPLQSIVRESIICNKPFVNEQLKIELNSISFPSYYLDFETFSSAIPIYPDIAPYAQIPIQYSLHKCSAPGKITAHFAYLADPTRDCRRELAERLIEDCGKRGSIFEYTEFEARIIKGLMEHCPDLKEKLEGIIGRLVDICKLIRDNYYDPGFHGSFSIKKVLPVMVSHMSYEGLEISDGQDASATYAYMVKGKYGKEEMEQKRKEMLEYCRMDTLAMVRLHEEMVKFG